MSNLDQAAQTMLNNIPEKTGKTLPQWHTLLKKSGLAKHGELMKLLKGEHAVSHGFANLIVHQYLNPAVADDDLINSQYAGAKADLKPIYEAVMKLVNEFGDDVEVSPKKAYVSLRRNKQFALIQPSTKTRVDVGLNLKGEPTTDRLEASGSFNAMCSHRVRIEEKKQIDAELKNWLLQAYERA